MAVLARLSFAITLLLLCVASWLAVSSVYAQSQISQEQTSQEQKRTIIIAGNRAVFHAVVAPYMDAIERDSDLIVDASQRLTQRQAIRALVDGKIDVAMIMSPLTDIVKGSTVKGEGVSRTEAARLDVRVVPSYEVGFFVNHANPVDRITKRQLTEILYHDIKNWKDIGGRSRAIRLITGPQDDPIRQNVRMRLLQGQSRILGTVTMVPEVRRVPVVTEKIDAALGIGLAHKVTKQTNVKQLQIIDDGSLYTFDQPLFFVTRKDSKKGSEKDSQSDVKAFMSLLEAHIDLY